MQRATVSVIDQSHMNQPRFKTRKTVARIRIVRLPKFPWPHARDGLPVDHRGGGALPG